jgi:hypothetical protein
MISADYKIWTWALEGTYGTDAVNVLLDADSAIVYQAVNNGGAITPIPINFQPDRARASQDGVASTFIKNKSSFSLPLPFKAGVGTPNTPPTAPVLKGCGFGENIDTAFTEYTLQTVLQPGFTLYNWIPELNTANHRLMLATGCLGNLAISGAANEEALFQVEGEGNSYQDWSTAAAYFSAAGNPILLAGGGASTSAATRDTSERLICRSATITWDGVSLPLSAWTIDCAMGIETVDVQTAHPTGVRVVRSRSGVSPATVSLALETGPDASAAYNSLRTKADAETQANLIIVLTGKTRKCTITARVQVLPRFAERPNAGQMGFDISGIIVGNFATHPFGNNSLSLKYETI